MDGYGRSATGIQSSLSSRILRIFVTFTLTLLSISLAATKALAENETDQRTDPSICVAIAYDNSGSMVVSTKSNQSQQKWCAAQYSLQVLAAMLGPNDEMALYTMDSPKEIKETFVGASGQTGRSALIDKLNSTDLKVSGNTDSQTAASALEYLEKSSAEKKYLVITTDGKFNATNGQRNENGLDDVRNTINQGLDLGYEVIYLAIQGTEDSEEDLSGDYTINDISNPLFHGMETTSDGILGAMTDVANIILGIGRIPDNYINKDTGDVTLPVSATELIVFAQGEGVQLGNLTDGEGNSLEPETNVAVHYKEQAPQYKNYAPGDINEALQGTIAEYKNVSKGECHIEVQNAASLDVYYKPDVDIETILSRPGNEGEDAFNLDDPASFKGIPAGTYSCDFRIVDGKNKSDEIGQEVMDQLGWDSIIYTPENVSNASFQQEGTNWNVTLDRGECSFKVDARMGVSATTQKQYSNIVVDAAEKPLAIDMSSVPDNISVGTLGSTSYPVTVTKAKDGEVPSNEEFLAGEPLTQDEWNTLNLSCKDSTQTGDSQGVEWSAEKSDQIGVVNITPRPIDGDTWKTQSDICGFLGLEDRAAQVTCAAGFDTSGNDRYYGANRKNITYKPDLFAAFLHLLPFLLLLLAIAILIYGFVTKPRLPRKMKPNIQYGNEEVPLKYSDKSIKNKFAPFTPEYATIRIAPKDSRLNQTTQFSSHFNLNTIGIVASRKKNGKRRFTLDDATIENMVKSTRNPGRFPDPEFNVKLPPSAYQDVDDATEGASAKSRKSKSKFKKPTMTKSSNIQFQGIGYAKPGRKPKSLEFIIEFKQNQNQ